MMDTKSFERPKTPAERLRGFKKAKKKSRRGKPSPEREPRRVPSVPPWEVSNSSLCEGLEQGKIANEVQKGVDALTMCLDGHGDTAGGFAPHEGDVSIQEAIKVQRRTSRVELIKSGLREKRDAEGYFGCWEQQFREQRLSESLGMIVALPMVSVSSRRAFEGEAGQKLTGFIEIVEAMLGCKFVAVKVSSAAPTTIETSVINSLKKPFMVSAEKPVE